MMFKECDVLQLGCYLLNGEINKNEPTHLVIDIDTKKSALLTAQHAINESDGPKRSWIKFEDLCEYKKVL